MLLHLELGGFAKVEAVEIEGVKLFVHVVVCSAYKVILEQFELGKSQLVLGLSLPYFDCSATGA